jgi:hypothetical protein
MSRLQLVVADLIRYFLTFDVLKVFTEMVVVSAKKDIN